ncbi:hypothetical protein ALC53_05221 [Atta colombica]|uniref:Uncharacterized protein n=1 Tax=Atta colombica TaxID=520822 RepID=A0A195BHY5_9HYME|nr:hypothetical protein ALC53_05221 [Atta colombica]
MYSMGPISLEYLVPAYQREDHHLLSSSSYTLPHHLVSPRCTGERFVLVYLIGIRESGRTRSEERQREKKLRGRGGRGITIRRSSTNMEAAAAMEEATLYRWDKDGFSILPEARRRRCWSRSSPSV